MSKSPGPSTTSARSASFTACSMPWPRRSGRDRNLSAEAAFIDSMRALATDPAARSLDDDAAVLEVGGETLVLTHDLIAEGVHYLPGDPPGDVAWKLVAVNLSDLAAKGALPLGVLLGFTLGDEAWDRAFAAGLAGALAAFSIPLLGGDTVAAPARVL